MSSVSIIVIGNSGAGKSFLVNLLLGREAVEHRFSARAVTADASSYSVRWSLGGHPCDALLWNLPAPGEPNGRNMQHNLLALQQAFSSAPRQLIVFVARARNGRLQAEDVSLFTELVRVYHLLPESVILVVNTTVSAPSIQWFTSFVELFGRTSAFVFQNVALLDNFGVMNFHSEQAQQNVSRVKHLLNMTQPSAHVREANTTDLVLSYALIRQYRDSIATVQRQMEEQLRVFVADRERIEARIEVLNAQEQEREQAHTQLLRTQQEQMNAAAAQEQAAIQTHSVSMTQHQQAIQHQQTIMNENRRIHEENMRQLQEHTRQLQEAAHQMIQQYTEAQEEAREQARKAKNIGRQLESMGKELIRHPLKALPMVITAIAIPELAPLLATSMGISTVAASAIVGASVGGINAALQHQNVIQGTLGGGLTGGVGALASTAPNLLTQTLTNSVASAGSAAITGHDPLTAAFGSAIQSTLIQVSNNSSSTSTSSTTSSGNYIDANNVNINSSSSVSSLSSSPFHADQIAISAASSVASNIVSRNQTFAGAFSSGLITGTVTAAAQMTIQEIKHCSSPSDAENKSVSKRSIQTVSSSSVHKETALPPPSSTQQSSTSSSKQPTKSEEVERTTINQDNNNNNNNNNNHHNSNRNVFSTESSNPLNNLLPSWHITSNDITAPNGMNIERDGSVGISAPLNSDRNSNIPQTSSSCVSTSWNSSDIYPGGFKHTTTVSHSTPVTTHIGSSSGHDRNAAIILPSSSVTQTINQQPIQEDIGWCYATRIQANTSTTVSASTDQIQSVINNSIETERHFSPNCIIYPTAGAVVIGTGMWVAPVVTAAIGGAGGGLILGGTLANQ